MTGPLRYLLSEEALAAARAGDAARLRTLGLTEDGVDAPGLRHAVGILDSAQVAVVATAFAPGETEYRRMKLAARAGEDDFVVAGGSEEIHDIVWLGDSTNAAMHLAEFLGLVFAGPATSPRSWDVSRDGWLALALIADERAKDQHRAELGQRSEQPLTVERMEAALAASTARGTRSAHYAAVRLAPDAAGGFDPAAGVRALAELGLLQESPGLPLEAPGEALVATLNQALLWGQLLLSNAAGDGTVTTVRSLTNSLIVAWDAEGSGGSVTLHSGPTAVFALQQFMRHLVDTGTAQDQPVSAEAAAGPVETAPRFCAACGKQLGASARFCGACGKPVG